MGARVIMPAGAPTRLCLMRDNGRGYDGCGIGINAGALSGRAPTRPMDDRQVSAPWRLGEAAGGAHEVSILITVSVGRCCGVEPRVKVSMMTMRPPQQGAGR